MRALPEIAKGKIPEDEQQQAYTVLVRNESNLTVYAVHVRDELIELVRIVRA